MLVIIMCICFEECAIKHNYTWRMTESFDAIFWNGKRKNKNMNIICGNAEVHTNKQRREQPEIWSKQPIWCRTCPPDGNMLLPGVIWSNRGPIVALWFDHANHCGKKRKKKKKASMNRSVCVCVCVCAENAARNTCLLNSARSNNFLAFCWASKLRHLFQRLL